jgi:hypothetical protein
MSRSRAMTGLWKVGKIGNLSQVWRVSLIERKSWVGGRAPGQPQGPTMAQRRKRRENLRAGGPPTYFMKWRSIQLHRDSPLGQLGKNFKP